MSNTTTKTIEVAPDLHGSANTQFIEAGGNKYAYRIFGKETGLPLVFLHHFTATIDDWDPQVTNGLAQHFKVVLLDNKGIGASAGQTPGQNWSISLFWQLQARKGVKEYRICLTS
jgi:pimeloyl-ACP methyl ester carboxylesterase